MDLYTIILYGKSGAGKGTQADLLLKYLKDNFNRDPIYVETGKGFRAFSEKDTYSAKLVKKTLEEGGLLPEFLPIWVWTDRLLEKVENKEDWVLDGLCRRLPEAPILDSAFNFFNRKNRFVVEIDVSNEWAKEKLLNRGRSDDNEKDIKTRLNWYEENTRPAIDYFKEKDGYDYLRINGEQTIEKVHKEVISKVFKNDSA